MSVKPCRGAACHVLTVCYGEGSPFSEFQYNVKPTYLPILFCGVPQKHHTIPQSTASFKLLSKAPVLSIRSRRGNVASSHADKEDEQHVVQQFRHIHNGLRNSGVKYSFRNPVAAKVKRASVGV